MTTKAANSGEAGRLAVLWGFQEARTGHQDEEAVRREPQSTRKKTERLKAQRLAKEVTEGRHSARQKKTEGQVKRTFAAAFLLFVSQPSLQ